MRKCSLAKMNDVFAAIASSKTLYLPVDGTDGNAAMRAGNNLRAAAFGMAVYCSHGMERTHIDGINNTLKLLTAYVLDI